MNRIPSRVPLDADVTIPVKKVSTRTIRRKFGECAGCYDPKTDAIWLDRDAPISDQWAVYRHEIVHASVDVSARKRGI